MFDPKATYIATASHPETENVDSNELCVHKRGSVNLHFLRHGMLRDYGNEEENYFNYIKSSVEEKSYDLNSTDKIFSGLKEALTFTEKPVFKQTYNNGSSKRIYQTVEVIDNSFPDSHVTDSPCKYFKCIPRVLNGGYLYIINETNNNEYYEYEVLEDFTGLKPILWTEDNLKDVRTANGSGSVDYITVRINSIVWIAYSPIQWTMEYMQKMVDNQDGIRNERMKKINCKGIDSSNKNDYIKEKIFSVFDVLPHFKIEKESNGNYKQSSEINKMSRMIANIVASEYEENIKLGDKNIYEDMFIVLDDVFGATNDICEYISEEDDKQRALINAAMTGSNSGTAPGDAPWLMQHVISFYQLFFRPEVQGNEELMKLKKKIIQDPKFYEKLLYVEERKDIRDLINKLREDLLAIIDSEPYRKAVYNFEQANDDVLIAGESLLLAQHKILIADPANNDRHLDKSQEKTPINDKIKSYFEILVNQENYSVGTVFGKQRNIEALVLTAMTSQWFNFQGLFTMVEPFKGDLKILIKHKWLNNPMIKSRSLYGEKETFLMIGKHDLNYILKKMGMEFKDVSHSIERDYKDLKGILLSNRKVTIDGLSINVQEDPNNKIYKAGSKLDDIISNKAFIALGGLISAYNLAKNIGNLKNDSKSEKAYAGLSIIGGATEMAWFMIKYAEKYQTVALDIFTNKVGIRLGPSIGARITSSFLGKVSFGIGVVTATFDSVMSFKRRDNDAGVAYIGVALCTAMSLFLITATGKGLAVSAVGVAGIGISAGALVTIFSVFFAVAAILIAVAIIMYLKDTPLECYFKNCILNSECTKKLTNWESMSTNVLVEKIITSKDKIIKSSFDEWKNLKYSYEEFALLTSNSLIEPSYDKVTGSAAYQTWEKDTCKSIIIKTNIPNISPNSILDGGIIVVLKSYDSKLPNKFSYIDFEQINNNENMEISAKEYGIEIKLMKIDYYMNDLKTKIDDGSLLGSDFANKYKVKHIYIYMRIINPEFDQNGKIIETKTFPYDNKYLINKIDVIKVRSHKVPVSFNDFLNNSSNYNDFCNREDKTVLTLSKLEALICSVS